MVANSLGSKNLTSTNRRLFIALFIPLDVNIYTFHCRDIHVLDCGGCPGPAGVSAKLYCMRNIATLKGQLSPGTPLVKQFRRKALDSHKMLSMPCME